MVLMFVDDTPVSESFLSGLLKRARLLTGGICSPREEDDEPGSLYITSLDRVEPFELISPLNPVCSRRQPPSRRLLWSRFCRSMKTSAVRSHQ